MAVKSHTINIKGTTAWNQLLANNYVILQEKDINNNDYILFKQVEDVELLVEQETGLYQMTQVHDIIKNEGLKEGYVLIIFTKI